MDDANLTSSPLAGAIYRFGLFNFDTSRWLLTRNGVRVRIQEQPLQVLALLLEKRGEVATREEICQRLWQDNTHVDFDKSLGVAISKVREALADPAANPRFVETVPRRGYRFIAPLTINDPPPTLAAENQSATPRETHPNEARDSTRRRFLWPIAVSLSAILAGLLVSWLHSSAHHPASPGKQESGRVHTRHAVAILGFRNLSGIHDYDWLSTAFAEMLHTELAANGDLRLVSTEDISNVNRDLSLTAGHMLDKGTLARLRARLGVDVVVLGSYAMLPSFDRHRIRLDLRVQDAALGHTIYEQAITGNENDLFDLVSQAGLRLRQTLSPAVALAKPIQRSRLPGAQNQLALQFYSQGRAALIAFDFVGARDLFKRAVVADPKLALAHSSLSEAWTHLGYGAEARSEAKRAFDLSKDLPQEEALQILGRFRESLNDWPNAVLTYRALWQKFPENLTYGLRLAAAQTRVNAADALATVVALRRLHAPLGDDPRIDLAESSALIGIDIQRARASAKRAVDRASIQGDNLLIARGFGILCQQDASLAQPLSQSVSECELARTTYTSAGDFNNAARSLNDLAGLYYQHGNLDKAELLWRSAMQEFRKFGDEEGLSAASNNLGDTLLMRGQLAEARVLLENTISDYQRLGDFSGMALVMADLGELAIEQADLPTGSSRYANAYAAACRSGDKRATAYALAGLGDVLLEQAHLNAARDRYYSALALRREVGEQQMITQTQIALARFSFEDGHPADAEVLIRQCLAQSHHDRFDDDELTAGLLLVDEMLSTLRVTDAVAEIASLRSLQKQTANRLLQLQFSLQSARALLATNDFVSAKTRLTLVLKQAESAGYTKLAWRARIHLAQSKMRLGERLAARKEFTSVKNRAKAAGFSLLANEATSLERESDSR